MDSARDAGDRPELESHAVFSAHRARIIVARVSDASLPATEVAVHGPGTG